MALLDIQSANYNIKHLVGIAYAILFGIISRANYISAAGLYRVLLSALIQKIDGSYLILRQNRQQFSIILCNKELVLKIVTYTGKGDSRLVNLEVQSS